MESLLEFHSLKPDNGDANLCGFGCADYNPGRCFSTGRGLLLHGLSVTASVAVVKGYFAAVVVVLVREHTTPHPFLLGSSYHWFFLLAASSTR